MARSKAQRAKRSRNRSTFELVARKLGVVKAVQRCDLRGVTQVQYNRAYRVWCKSTALEYFNTPAPDTTGGENLVWDWGIGATRLNERIRQANRSTKAPLVHVRTSTQSERKLRNARKHYRRVKRETGWSGSKCDVAFKANFPSEWRLIAGDDYR